MKKKIVTAAGISMILAASVFMTGQAEGVTLEYSETMQELGYTEPVVLDYVPERVVSMSSAPILALYELGINMIAVPSTSLVEWPEDLMANAELLQAAMNSAFDIETVIALEPDLVIMAYASQDTYGVILESINIPVYYVDAGHTVTYESVKEQTQALINAFAPDSEKGEALMQRFDELEMRLEEMRQKLEGITCMVLQSSPPTHYIQTEDGTLGSMARLLGLENVYENSASSMVEMDYEMVLGYDPDLVLAAGASETAEEHEALMLDAFEDNPDYWASIEAIAQGNMICLPVTYVSSAGLNIIDNINSLADVIEAHLEK